MTLRMTYVVLLLTAWLLPVSTSWAQVATSCELSGPEPALAVGTINTTPTPQQDTATNVTVSCRAFFAGGTVKACLKLSNGSPDTSLLPQRRMANGAARLGFQMHRDTARTQVWGDATTAAAREVQVVMQNVGFLTYAGSTTVPMYGRVAGGQTGLPSGTYQSDMALTLTGTFDLTANCNSVNTPLQSLSVPARATIARSCSVAANDLSFGSHSQLAAAVTASTSLGVTCTVGTPYTVRMDGGTTANNVADRRMGLNGTGPAAQGVAYQLRHTSPNGPLWGDGTSGTSTLAGTGTGGSQTLRVYGRVLPQAVPLPGQYEDTVTVTVQY